MVGWMFTAAAEQIYKVVAKNSVNIWQICWLQEDIISFCDVPETWKIRGRESYCFMHLNLWLSISIFRIPQLRPVRRLLASSVMEAWLCGHDQQSPHGASILWFIDVYVLMANFTRQLKPLIYAECFKQLKTVSAHGWDSQRRFHEEKIIIG